MGGSSGGKRVSDERGAFIEEYALLVAAVIAVAILMAGYFRDSLRGMIRWVEILYNSM